MSRHLIQNIFILIFVLVCLVLAVDHLTIITSDTMVRFNTTSNETEHIRYSTWLLRQADLAEEKLDKRLGVDMGRNRKSLHNNIPDDVTDRDANHGEPHFKETTDWHSMIGIVIFLGIAMFCFGLTCCDDDYWYYN